MNYVTSRLTRMKRRRKMRIKTLLSGIFCMSSWIKLGNQNGGLSLYLCSVTRTKNGNHGRWASWASTHVFVITFSFLLGNFISHSSNQGRRRSCWEGTEGRLAPSSRLRVWRCKLPLASILFLKVWQLYLVLFSKEVWGAQCGVPHALKAKPVILL